MALICRLLLAILASCYPSVIYGASRTKARPNSLYFTLCTLVTLYTTPQLLPISPCLLSQVAGEDALQAENLVMEDAMCHMVDCFTYLTYRVSRVESSKSL
jgi:hypothetical protein